MLVFFLEPRPDSLHVEVINSCVYKLLGTDRNEVWKMARRNDDTEKD